MDKDSYEKGFQDGHKCCAYEKEKLLAQNARYREALEFYADKKKWSLEYDEYNRGFSRWCIMYGDLEEINEHVGYCGLRAREALKGE